MDVGASTLEKIRMKKISYFIAIFLVAGCASKVLKYDKTENLKNIKEFDQAVKIEEGAAAPTPSAPVEVVETKELETKKKKKTKATPVVPVALRHQPELESDEGFIGRRPIKDPFRVGEKVVHSVRYLKMKAGILEMEVKPFVQVNGRPAYSMNYHISSSSIFSSIYSVDDSAVTLMDFETMIPSVFTLHVRESTQIREARYFFDRKKLMSQFWEKKVTDKSGEEERKLEWESPDYSQNVFSAAYYMRVFNWRVGSENSFRVADTGENLIFKAKAIRAETISTEVGEFNAIVIKPEIQLKNQFKPVGDIFIWLSDDDRKFILKIESKIKIGYIVSEITELNRGAP